MADFWDSLTIPQLKISDIVDILIVWFVFYSLLRFLKGSRARQMILGLLALFLLQIAAELFNLISLSTLIGSLFNIIPIAIIVLFQEEIRRVLVSIGTNPFNATVGARSSVLDSIFRAILKLSEKETGALVVFEGKHGLKTIIESGTRLDARPSAELLVDIFNHKSTLHDGAVIISNSRIASAACLLPLSHNSNLPKSFGTRHRAAIGVTEESDSIGLIVSEETGRISFTKDGSIFPVSEKNMSKLYETYNALAEEETMSGSRDLFKTISKGILSKWSPGDHNGAASERADNHPKTSSDPSPAKPAHKTEQAEEAKAEEVAS